MYVHTYGSHNIAVHDMFEHMKIHKVMFDGDSLHNL